MTLVKLYYCRKGRRKSVDFLRLQEDMKKYELDIEIYHFKKTIYQWEGL